MRIFSPTALGRALLGSRGFQRKAIARRRVVAGWLSGLFATAHRQQAPFSPEILSESRLHDPGGSVSSAAERAEAARRPGEQASRHTKAMDDAHAFECPEHALMLVGEATHAANAGPPWLSDFIARQQPKAAHGAHRVADGQHDTDDETALGWSQRNAGYLDWLAGEGPVAGGRLSSPAKCWAKPPQPMTSTISVGHWSIGIRRLACPATCLAFARHRRIGSPVCMHFGCAERQQFLQGNT